jgi:hypothetical protein
MRAGLGYELSVGSESCNLLLSGYGGSAPPGVRHGQWQRSSRGICRSRLWTDRSATNGACLVGTMYFPGRRGEQDPIFQTEGEAVSCCDSGCPEHWTHAELVGHGN